jgi:hypothetical protein
LFSKKKFVKIYDFQEFAILSVVDHFDEVDRVLLSNGIYREFILYTYYEKESVLNHGIVFQHSTPTPETNGGHGGAFELELFLDGEIYEAIFKHISGYLPLPYDFITSKSTSQKLSSPHPSSPEFKNPPNEHARIKTRYTFSDEIQLTISYIKAFFSSLNIIPLIQEFSFDPKRKGCNVIVEIPGTSSLLKGETIVIGAHFDSISEKPFELAPGAVDNGAGTSGVMLLAFAYNELIKSKLFIPKRTVKFVLFGGEEQGLKGIH